MTPWPLWPLQLRMESSHEEGGKREWARRYDEVHGRREGNVKQLHGVRVGRAEVRADPGHGIHARCGPGAAGHGLHGPGEEPA